jgi:hypothetical protein
MPTTRPYNTFAVYTQDSNYYSIDSLTAVIVTMNTAATLPTSRVTITIESPTTVGATSTYLVQILV